VNSLAFGVAAGLGCALFSSISYLVSRHHGTRRSGGSRRLLVLAHLLMGIACLPVAWQLIPAEVSSTTLWSRSIWTACFVSTGSYFVGQACVFYLLTRADASKLSPLLGLKIIALALIVSLVLQQSLAPGQWLAVALCAAATVVQQRGGAGVTATALALLGFACCCFAVADLGIVALIDALELALPISRLRAGSLAMALTYVLGGLFVLPLVATEYARPQRPTSRDWLAAAEYSAAWLTAMVSLYACIGSVGVVLSTILQSTRGVMSVVIGAVLAHLGWHDLESRVDQSMFFKRLAAAVLMTAAIATYVWSAAGFSN
jgi:hypothetical protein